MAETTGIEWADSTWDPWRGCTKVSRGCANCYAERLGNRNPEVFGGWGPGAKRVESKSWHHPVYWNAKAKDKGTKPWVFPSKCDWLDEEVGSELRFRFLDLIRRTPHLRWLLLTKRPKMWQTLIEKCLPVAALSCHGSDAATRWLQDWLDGIAPGNVWIGTSVEDQESMDRRGPLLCGIPAAMRFLSMEPLLEDVDMGPAFWNFKTPIGVLSGVDWVIVGGESGPKARPCEVGWIRSVVVQCKFSNVPCFVKQLGSLSLARKCEPMEFEGVRMSKFYPANERLEQRIHDHSKGGNPAEWPEYLRVREFPKESK